MPNYFTRSGDNGTSGLLGDTRVPKDHPRLEVVGIIDEANAALGIARSVSQIPQIKDIILTVQRDLYNMMTEVASTPEVAPRFRKIDTSNIKWLESQIEKIGEKIQNPKEFIIPGDTIAGANLDLARTVIRRAERRISTLFRSGELENKELQRYLNRLSSLCFVLELWEHELSSTHPISLAKDQKT